MSTDATQKSAELFNRIELTDEQMNMYREQGYLNVGRTLTDRGLQQMIDEVMKAWHQQKLQFDPKRTWLQNSLLSDIHHLSATVRRYYFSGPPVDIAQQVIGPNIKAATAQLTFKMRGNTQPFDWHQDNAYGELDPYNAISTLTALDDASEENGCLWLVPSSHKQGQAKPTDRDQKAKREFVVTLDIDDSLGVPMPMKAGECLFFHCHMLHKSEGNLSKNRDRRIMFARYADADAVEVYNDGAPRLGRLVRGKTRFHEVEAYEADLPLN